MSPRTGRPIIGEKKDIDVRVRFDKKTHGRLMEYCEKNQTTRTEVIRESVDLFLEQKK